MVKRNHSYSVGDIEYTANDYILKCKTAGTTALDPLVINSGGAITDGTCEWEVMSDGDLPSGMGYSFDVSMSTNSTWSIVNWVAPADGYVTILSATKAQSVLKLSVGANTYSSVTGISDGRHVGTNVLVRAGGTVHIQTINTNSGTAKLCWFEYTIKSAKELGLL